jgi:hypothetical protein
MNEPIAGVNSWSEACRRSLAPLLRIQQDGLGALDRFARCQYAVAGDFLEWSLALSKIMVAAQSPADFLAKQAQIGATAATTPGPVPVVQTNVTQLVTARSHARDAAPKNGQSPSKHRSAAPGRATRDSGKPKNRNKT